MRGSSGSGDRVLRRPGMLPAPEVGPQDDRCSWTDRKLAYRYSDLARFAAIAQFVAKEMRCGAKPAKAFAKAGDRQDSCGNEEGGGQNGGHEQFPRLRADNPVQELWTACG